MRLSPAEASHLPQAVLHARYPGHIAGEIDRYEAVWERSLRLALGPAVEDHLADIVLALREAVLNALEHGCAGDPQSSCTLHASWVEARRRLLVRVEDPGPGHAFDWKARLGELEALQPHSFRAQALPTGGLGMVLLHGLADRLTSLRRGSSLRLVFALRPSDPDR